MLKMNQADFGDTLKRGLFNKDRAPDNELILVEATNTRICEIGLEKVPSIIDPNDEGTIILPDEHISDGGFDDPGKWTAGVGWSVSGSVATRVSTTPNTEIHQTLANLQKQLRTGVYYQISFDITARTSGSVYVRTGLTGTASYSSIGTHTEIIQVDGTLQIYVDTIDNFVGSIDNLSVKEVVKAAQGTWPYPQLFHTSNGTLLLTETDVFTMDTSVTPWSATKSYVYDESGNLSSIPAGGGPWQVADYYGGYVLTKDNVALLAGVSDAHVDLIKGKAVDVDNYSLSTNMSSDAGILHVGTSTLGLFNSAIFACVSGHTYLVEVYIENYVGSDLQLEVGDIVQTVPSGTSGVYTFNGTVSVDGYFKVFTSSSSADLSGISVRDTSKYALSDLVKASRSLSTAAYHKGRVVLGGFSASDTYPQWDSSLPSLTSDEVAWTSIGASDLRHYFVTGSESYEGEYDELKRLNQAGYAKLPQAGGIVLVKSLGDHVVVYGNNTIVALKDFVEPVPTYGVVEVSKFGVLSRGAVSGDDQEHVFIDSEYKMWKLTRDLQVHLLDYEAHINGPSGSPTFAGKTVKMSFDERLRDHYICASDGSSMLAYLLSPTGLSRIEYMPTEIMHINGGMYASYVHIDTTVSIADDMIVAFGSFDLGLRGVKTIHSVQVLGTWTGTLTAIVYARTDKTQAFDRQSFGGADTPNKQAVVGPDGVANLTASGEDFQLELRADTYTNVTSIDGVKVNWYKQGKRSIRDLFS